MQGKIVGGYVKKCSEGKKWDSSATLFVQQELPSGDNIIQSDGYCVRSVVCQSSRLPDSIKNMVGHTYAISTNNHFASEFFKIN